MSIPVIDLSRALAGDPAARLETAAAIDAACRSLGFLVISGHGVPDALVAAIRETSAAFFRLPEAEKAKIAVTPTTYRGFIPIESESLSLSLDEPAPADLKEVYNIGPVDVSPEDRADLVGLAYFAENVFPDAVPGMREAYEAYYRAMTDLARELMRLFALGLKLPETFFDGRIDRHITNLSVLHYPPLNRPAKPGQLRAGVHSDYGSLTILQRDETPGGLEVLSEGRWTPVPDIPGAFVVNLGDLMQDWTGGAWKSTLHRVVLPPDLGMGDRMSIAFFHQPNHDAVIEVLPIEGADPSGFVPVTSGAHLMTKIAKHRAVEHEAAE
ncbi:isopenicillin N synthase family dioxygenase [Chthonobacter rhizosphaerae]|uniref:isopenicillin N synthase family dioxygenase n=1 Tax=Chthonobacter rhizosphaerae TaxID=2735553 RepID=UPI0015EF68F8|nr:isopenicillin N synthase family oxygenase [Chthonobacter rhizosphaerae]